MDAASFAERFDFRVLDRLDRAAAARALLEPAVRLAVVWEPVAAATALQAAGGSPYLIQLLGDEAWALASPDRGGVITQAHVAAATEEVQQNLDAGMFRGRWGKATDAERDLVVAHARALIRRQVRLTLIDRRRRTAIDNLVKRTLKRLDQTPFARTGAEPTTWSHAPGTSPAPAPPAGADRNDRAKLTQRLSALPRARHKGLKRANRIWNAETLEQALDDIVATLDTVSRQEIEEIFAAALTSLNVSEFVDVEAAEKFVASGLGPEEETMVTELVTRAVASLTPEESAVLAGKFRGLSDDEVAKELGRSRPTIASRKQSGAAKVREATLELDLETQNEVLERVQLQILKVNQ